MLRLLHAIEERTSMIERIYKAFKEKAFIPFVTAGDPDIETTEKLILKMLSSGADMVEIGIPFSDPTAEGPVIQEANIRALKNNITTDDVFSLVQRLRKQTDKPLLFMTYANVVFSYGSERFAIRAKESGLDGIILPDVPFEERDEFYGYFKSNDIALISMIAPTSEERISSIAKNAEGFIYCVSSLGVTGVRSNITTDIASMVELVRKANSTIPVAIGFGISTEEQARKMAGISDGVIVGSAIVKLCAAYKKDCIGPIGEYVRAMKSATLEG